MGLYQKRFEGLANIQQAVFFSADDVQLPKHATEGGAAERVQLCGVVVKEAKGREVGRQPQERLYAAWRGSRVQRVVLVAAVAQHAQQGLVHLVATVLRDPLVAREAQNSLAELFLSKVNE